MIRTFAFENSTVANVCARLRKFQRWRENAKAPKWGFETKKRKEGWHDKDRE